VPLPAPTVAVSDELRTVTLWFKVWAAIPPTLLGLVLTLTIQLLTQAPLAIDVVST
jgi:hypothetical protein